MFTNHPNWNAVMVYVLIGLAVLFVISYSTYRLAKTERVGFKALLAWVTLAVIIAMMIISWILGRLLDPSTVGILFELRYQVLRAG